MVVNHLDASDYLVENAKGLLWRKYFVVKFALEVEEVANVTVFHDEEVPISLWIDLRVH